MISRCLPPSPIRWIGRLQYKVAVLAPVIRSRAAKPLASGVQIVRYGTATGLIFENWGGFPGYAMGTTEPEEQRALERLLKPSDVVFDIGANVGFHPVICARLVGPQGNVWAFEALDRSAQMIERNSALNGFSNLHVKRVAIPNHAGQASLDVSGNSALHSIRETDGREDGEKVTAETTSVDISVDEMNVLPDLIKVDVEGAEILVLARQISVAFHSAPDSSRPRLHSLT